MAFTLAFLSFVRVIVIETESRTKPKNVIRSAGMTVDFSIFIPNPKLVNKDCVPEIFSGNVAGITWCPYPKGKSHLIYVPNI